MAEGRWGEPEASERPDHLTERDRWLREVAKGLDALPDAEAETLAELEAHLDDRTADVMARGISREVAERRAIDRMGDPHVLGRELRRARLAPRNRLALAGSTVLALIGYTGAGTTIALLAVTLLPSIVLPILAMAFARSWDTTAVDAPPGYGGLAALAVGVVWACRAVPVAVARATSAPLRTIRTLLAALVLVGGLLLALFAPGRDIDAGIALISVLIPIVGAIAALRSPRTGELRVTRPLMGLAALAIALPMLVWPATAGSWRDTTAFGWDARTDPAVDGSGTPPDGLVYPSADGASYTATGNGNTELRESGVRLSGWTRLTLEEWRLDEDGAGNWHGTLLSRTPMQLVGSDLVGIWPPLPASRDRYYYATLQAGVDPTGVRRIISGADVNLTPWFRGSVWEWLAASS